ncbi:uncharacterized protein L3040_003162 [Drepanopeziza brunnea f. sp. 'multigermtubi']|uniref:uncharacterized protein n=1 Tax=Drepanopeziza brunnea f. sp. 'multigermtubi' TaxID=698441 RepID=UPI00239D66F1|nr:hypothetical protein L3040_003162 [Drepanopeziza brunnea f. sp. 'multigermtubi']
MPLMMDDEMDMDDLFGDGGGLSLPSRPPPTKELHQRIDELRTGGCCQGIAWSRWGCIASIAPNGMALELRNLRCDPADGTWALSSPTVTANFSSPLDGRLKHLSWSPTGSDLAVIDTTGRVTIISIFASLNKASLSRDCRADPADDLHGVIGCYWLNLAAYPANRPNILHGPAIKEGSGYRFESSQTPVLGPCLPNQSRSAFVCVTTNGTLRVLWQQNNSKWNESHTELESIVSSDDLITHAAICSDKNGTLLIAYTTASMQLRTVRALIEWNQPKVDKVPPANLPLNPTIKTRHLAGTSWAPTISSDPMNTSPFDSSMVQISHLELLPPFADANSKSVPPTIITIRSSLPTFAAHYTQDVHTTVDRWEIRDKIQSVHHAFEQLSSRRNGAGHPPQPVVYLKKLESFTVKKVVVSMESINHGKVIAFACSDNSIEYRDRTDMSETFNDGNLERVWHLSQIGFAYTDDEPCLQVSLSPTYCSAVQLRNDGKVKWKQLNYHLRQIGTSTDDPLYSAAIAAITLSCATAVMRNANWDDILATIQPYATAQFAYDWLADFTPLIKLNADFSEETHHDVLVRNTTIQLCLCIQYSIGFKGEFNPRTFSGKLAWLVLQLRSIVVVVTMAANLHLPGPGGPNANERTTPLEDPEVINSLVGSVRWALDLVAWIIDTLLTLPTTLPPHITLTNASTLSLPDLLSYLHKTNTISLHLLLSSPSRGFLTAVCRRLQHLDFIACKAVLHNNATLEPNPANPNPSPPTKVSPALKAAYVQIAQLTGSSILNIKTLETLLASITSLIKNSYASSTNPVLSGSAPAERTRNNIEMKMLFGSSFPDAFKPVIVELFRKEGLLDGVKEQIDSSQLFFADFSMLEVDENKASVERRRRSEKTMDCFRKVWLENPPKGLAAEVNGRQGRWRRCARCAAVMEDVLTQRQALQWLIMQQRRCFCGGFWNTIAPGKTIA